MSDNEILIAWGSPVKALDEDGDRLKVGGNVVLYGTPATADLSPTKDYFTATTDYGFDVAERGRVRWHHGMDQHIGRRVLGLVDFKASANDIGVWAEGWIKLADAYEKKVAEWIKAGKAGWSTGVPAHCVGRKAVGAAHEVIEWPLGADISITLTPADPRQVGGVVSLKSWIGSPEAPAPGELYVDTCLRLASDLTASVARFAKLSVVKRDAIKSLRDSLDGVYHASAPVDPAELAALAEEARSLRVLLA